MAPRIVEEQTEMIINCLFEDAMVRCQGRRGFTEPDGFVLHCAGEHVCLRSVLNV